MEYRNKLREVLESKFAIYVLLLIKEQSEDPNIKCNKTTIFSAEKGNERTKFLRIRDLMDVGLVERDFSQINHNTIYLQALCFSKNSLFLVTSGNLEYSLYISLNLAT